MFRRTFWFTAGAAAGVWATTKAQRKLRQLAPDSLAAQAAHRTIGAGRRMRDFALDVRDGMHARENELGEALGIAPAPREAPGTEAPGRLTAAPRQDPYRHGTNDRPAGPGDNHPGPYNRNEDH
ncbi:DUF6167 family protein [Streptomyces sp. NPDC050560]|uniref:DUF6167 family protein n=1 Tax=Streptomyces sp. NPDC050560 TaxID=3365630 RepID=UPI0037BA3005